MKPEEQQRILDLAIDWRGERRLSKEAFLRQNGVTDGVALGLDYLREAVHRRDPVDLELALIVSFVFGFSDEHLGLLIPLAWADWHFRHEDLVSALERIHSPAAVEALAHLARWKPDYMDYDDTRSLARNAIWALGKIGGDAAERELRSLAQSECDIVAEGAREQLER